MPGNHPANGTNNEIRPRVAADTTSAERRLESLCRVAVALTSMGFAIAAFWELNDSFAAGHFAAPSAVCTAAENMWRWGTLGPVIQALDHAPRDADYYCHHPWGMFWVSALFMKMFGHHAWACRLPAALQSTCTVPALYLAGRALWGPISGAVCALGFAVLPIALSFSDFNSLEVPVIFGVVLAIWGYARFRSGHQKRFAALALCGLVYAVCSDWAGAIFAASMFFAVLLRVLLPRTWAVPVPRTPIVMFWGAGVVLCGLVIAAHLYAFSRLGQWDELWSQGRLRSNGSELPLQLVLAARKFWIEVSFTGLAIALGKLALPVHVVRLAVRRCELEALPLAVFCMAAFQYVVFKQGADVHIFWPHYFALYFALAWAALVQSALDLTQHWLRQSPRRLGLWPSYGWLCLGLLVPLAILPDGLRALAYAHRSGGRFNENGHPIKPDKDKVAALEWLAARMAKGSGLILHAGMRQSLWVDWAVQHPVSTVNRLPLGPGSARNRYYVADLRYLRAAEQDALLANFSPIALGPFLTIDRVAPPGKLTAYSIERLAPSRFEAYWVSSSHALRSVVADPFLTWELRDRFHLTPNEPPVAEPTSHEQQRIAHNIAVSRGDAAAADHWLLTLLADCDGSHARSFEDGNTLIGSRLERGPSLLFTVYFRAASADPSEPTLVMHSVVSEAQFASLVQPDRALAEVGVPFTIPASRWKQGFVYASISEVIRRIGSERWYATFRASQEGDTPHAGKEFELLRIE